ncbi:MAG: 6,7-dimethyl-8-ribityllumazine synthase, partial [Mariprofundales bacterium]|nr:6,7-dimethyl-8-ribityllumazine synthase [Mariprofundales bacterium]
MSDDRADLRGEVDASGLRIAIVVSRFNQKITDKLLDGAVDALTAHGADERMIEVVSVPGALEIGTVAARLVQRGGVDLLICLGCVIKGGSAHFEHVCREAMRAIAAIAARGDIAVGNGLLTVDTV